MAQLALELVTHGFCIVTGGGPGIMEAANLGAYLAGDGDGALNDALSILSKAPKYPGNQAQYVAAASAVRAKYGDSGSSLAIPTWAYSDEPTGPFSSGIGKYFSNSIREERPTCHRGVGRRLRPVRPARCKRSSRCGSQQLLVLSFPRTDDLLGRSFFGQPPSIFDVVKARAKQDG